MKQLLFISIIVAFFSGCDSSNSSKVDEFKEGDICVLRTGDKNIIVSRTKDELDKIIHLATINDNEGITLEILARMAFIVDAETRVKVINASFTVSEVRIESGTYTYQTGWVPNEFIKK